jgi:hypothetical protein
VSVYFHYHEEEKAHRYLNIHVETEEKRNRIALASRSVPYAMNCRDEDVIRDPLQEIANIDNKSAIHRLCWNVEPVLIQHFQSPEHILVEDCERF